MIESYYIMLKLDLYLFFIKLDVKLKYVNECKYFDYFNVLC